MRTALLRKTLPTHPVTHVAALGWRRNGEPIWPVRGGADDFEDDADADDQDDDQDDDDRDDEDGKGKGKDEQGDRDSELGEKGQRALERTKARAKAERARRVKAERELQTLKAGRKTEADEADADKVREQARAEARAEVMAERVENRVEAKAARLFTDPADAVAQLRKEIASGDFHDDGQVDDDAIVDALEDLLKRKPYLGLAAGSGDKDGDGRKGRESTRRGGSADSGSRKDSSDKPKTLQAAVTAGLTPKRR